MKQLKKPDHRANNRKTALWVGGLALVFFIAIFIRRIWMS